MPTRRDPFQLETAEGFRVIGATPSSKPHAGRTAQKTQESKKKSKNKRKQENG